MKRTTKDKPNRILTVLGILGGAVLLGLLLLPKFIRPRAVARGDGGCKSNLKNIGTALEMYSTDRGGKYPKTLQQLVPNYLKTMPECRSSEKPYRYLTGKNVAYNTEYEDYYFLMCEGDNHDAYAMKPNYPQYDGIHGLIEVREW